MEIEEVLADISRIMTGDDHKLSTDEYNELYTLIRSQREETFKQGVEAAGLRDEVGPAPHLNLTDGEKLCWYAGQEAFKASLLNPAAARLAQSMEMQASLAEDIKKQQDEQAKTMV